MLNKIIKSIFWDPSEKKVKYYATLIAEIKEKEEEFKNFYNQFEIISKMLLGLINSQKK